MQNNTLGLCIANIHCWLHKMQYPEGIMQTVWNLHHAFASITYENHKHYCAYSHHVRLERHHKGKTDWQLKVRQLFFRAFFCVSCLPVPRGRYRTSFDQVSEFDRGRIVAYSDCGSSLRGIGQHVGRNQATVMQICYGWMQEGTTDRRGRLHQPRCTTALDDKQLCAWQWGIAQSYHEP